MNPRSSGNETDPFLPFQLAPAPPLAAPAPSVGSRGDLKLPSRAEGAPPFLPVQMSGNAPGHGPHSGRPTITLERDGDRVTGIRVECACGQVIELACRYTSDESNPLAP
jgi:hypothetical protein